MFATLHKGENEPADGWTISPSKFFSRVFLGSLAFYFLPGLLMPALSTFNVITWFAPKNVVVANLVGLQAYILSGCILIFAVWSCFRSWSVPFDVRLGTDCICRITACGTSLGGSQHFWWPRFSHVACGPIDVYAALCLQAGVMLTSA
jgi:hypothetical protein